MEAFDLAGGGRGIGRGQDVVDPVLAADAVEEHLHRRLEQATGEDLAVVGQDLVRHAVPAQSGAEAFTDLARPFAVHEAGRDAVPGVVIQAGEGLGRGSIRELEAADHIELPQLHRRGSLPALEVFLPVPPADGIYHSRSDQPAIDG